MVYCCRYGAPGTGKTSFARSLAKELGRVAFEIRQGDEDGKNMKSEARMMGIQVCNGQEDPTTSLMIVDESDELLRGSSCGFGLFGLFGFDTGGKSTEKGVMNSILDEMKIPAVWISNASARESAGLATHVEMRHAQFVRALAEAVYG